MNILKFIVKVLAFQVIFFTTLYVTKPQKCESCSTFFQLSTIDALLAGNYDGTATVKDLKRIGNFGHGTLDKLDGELYVLNGDFYQIDYDGKVHKVDDSTKIPYINLTSFKTDYAFKNLSFDSYEKLQELGTEKQLSENFAYAIKIHGDFETLKLRSIAKQKKPYPSATEVIANQAIFNLEKTSGTLVGFLLPKYLKGVTVPGYHFHFLTDDKDAGGHLLDFSMLKNAKVEIDLLDSISLKLPMTGDFSDANLNKDRSAELDTIEKDK